MAALDALTLKQLRALVAVVDTQSVTAAAERLRVTAPAISTQIKTLEDHLGTAVVARPQFTPTAAGAELVAAARRVETTLARALQNVAALKAGRAGTVVLGVTSTGKYFAPALLGRIAAAMPELDVSLVVGNRADIVAGLDDGRLDLAITGRPPRVPAVDARVLGDHPHVWVAAPEHPIVTRRGVDPAELAAGETILAREPGSGTRSLMERLLAGAGVDAAPRMMVFASNETIKQAAIARLGVAFLSGHTLVAEVESGRLALVDVVGTPVVRRWFAVVAADRTASAATSRVFDFVVGLNGAFLPVRRGGWSR